MATPCRPGTLVHSLKSDINGRWRAPLAITRLGCLNTTWTVNSGNQEDDFLGMYRSKGKGIRVSKNLLGWALISNFNPTTFVRALHLPLMSDFNECTRRWRAPLAITRLGCLNTTWTVNAGIKKINSRECSFSSCLVEFFFLDSKIKNYNVA